MTLARLEAEYKAIIPLADRFAGILREQLSQLLEDEGISLSFPIQHRVKAWSSVAEKIKRLSLSLSTIRDLNDLVGLRLVLPFKREIDKVCQLLPVHLKVLEQYDTQERLKEDQFGYSSVHFIIEVPETWLIVPTLSHMSGLRAEVQVRTTAQHIWAAASHTLQYKHEKSVPSSMRRAIHRLSAVLETVDLEFEEVLKQREAYQKDISANMSHKQKIREKLEEEENDPEAIKEIMEAFSVDEGRAKEVWQRFINTLKQ